MSSHGQRGESDGAARVSQRKCINCQNLGSSLPLGWSRIKMVPGIQWGAGYSAAFSLLPVSLPFTVELDRDWIEPPDKPLPLRFWPIIFGNRPVNASRHPIDQIQDAVRDLGANPALPATATLIATALQLMDRVVADQDLRAYLSDPDGSSRIRQAISATETWLVTGDTGNLPAAMDRSRRFGSSSRIVSASPAWDGANARRRTTLPSSRQRR